MVKLLLVLVLSIASSTAVAQSKIVTISGSTYTGLILNEDNSGIFIRTIDSIDVKIPREKIESISYGRTVLLGPEAAPKAQVDESAVQDGSVRTRSVLLQEESSHYAFGLALGTPGALMANGAYYSDDFGVRFSLTPPFLFDMGGIQASVLHRFVHSGPFELSAGLISGYMFIDDYPQDDSWLYTGGALNLELFGFFTELGLSLGVGSFSNPQLMFQFGYAYHFR